MKSVTMNLMLATAALMVASTVASAQTVKATIPFAFQYKGKVMPAGTYRVTDSGVNPWLEVANVRTREKTFMVPQAAVDPQKEWLSSPGGILQFTCRDGACVLTRVWTNSGKPARTFPGPKTQDHANVAVISLAADPTM